MYKIKTASLSFQYCPGFLICISILPLILPDHFFQFPLQGNADLSAKRAEIMAKLEEPSSGKVHMFIGLRPLFPRGLAFTLWFEFINWCPHVLAFAQDQKEEARVQSPAAHGCDCGIPSSFWPFRCPNCNVHSPLILDIFV